MNLHGIVAGYVGAVNPQVPISVQISTGSTTDADGKRVPTYADPATYIAQIQALEAGELRQLEALNIQGIKRAIYVNGRVDGLVRSQNKGGDLVTFGDGAVWLIVLVLEYWPGWCKFAVTLQNGA